MRHFHIAVCLLVLGSVARGATYYVDSVAGDNIRTKEEAVYPEFPWKSISMAAAYIDDGDVVMVKNGTYGVNEEQTAGYYDITATPRYDKDGIVIDDNNVTFQGYFGDPATPQTPSVPSTLEDWQFTEAGGDWPYSFPVIKGADRTQNAGFYAAEAHDLSTIWIKNFYIRNFKVGIRIENTAGVNRYHYIDNVLISDIGDPNYESWTGTVVVGIGVFLKNSDNNIISNCVILNATSSALRYIGDSTTISDCAAWCNAGISLGPNVCCGLNFLA